MDTEECAFCGHPARGYARIGDLRYCHGDEPGPSCYEQAQWDIATGSLDGLELWLESSAGTRGPGG